MADFHQLCDMDSGKVLAAALSPFLVWGTNLELALKIAAAAGAVVYICVKILLLVKNRKEP